jgi:signal transduction histidine kinase
VALGLLALAMTAALALGAREARRTRRLNRCLHELRRPLQALELAGAFGRAHAEGSRALADQVAAALQDLDWAINGGRRGRAPGPVRLGAVTSALAARWAHADVRVLATGADATVLADPRRLGAAVDNLVANGLDHGSGTVEVLASSAAGRARIEVRDRGPARREERAIRDPRHGHGLRVAAEAAAGSGGRLIGPSIEDGRTVAAIALPVRGESPG